ncbi:MAG: protein phosphatase 2C domain-containing protein [Chloroflexi bacterium]|nr:protein phosphatase 2C domain-containing protein [Chloroflexota bacterium]MYE40854.1 protein phosphatase 2C domain-containing protein [Chloroflexota bacterium]
MNKYLMPPQDEWQVCCARSQGNSHAATGQPCQDFVDTLCVPYGKRKIEPYSVVLAVADGAGSAERSHEGSQLAVDSALETISQLWPKSRLPGTRKLKKVLESAFASASESISKKAEQDGTTTRQFATTLLIAIVVDNGVAVGQIGDGAIVTRTVGQEYDVLIAPQRGQYRNETSFVTDPGSSPVVMAKAKTTVDRIALFTDGLENLVIAQADGKPHSPFFDGLFRWIEMQHGDHEAVSKGLKRLLDDPKTRSKTNDDLSLAVACRNVQAGEAKHQ